MNHSQLIEMADQIKAAEPPMVAMLRRHPAPWSYYEGPTFYVIVDRNGAYVEGVGSELLAQGLCDLVNPHDDNIPF